MELSHERVRECLAKFNLSLMAETEAQVIRQEQEIYLTIMNDRRIKKPVLVAGLEKKVNFEAHSVASSGILVSEIIDPLWGVRSYQVTNIAIELNLMRERWHSFELLVNNLFKIYIHFDCTFASFSFTFDLGENFKLNDARMTLDDNALFRHSDLIETVSERPEWLLDYRLNYRKLDGQIGCIVNGAGLAMTIIDMIYQYSDNQIQPANFLDVCGIAALETVAEAVLVLAGDTNIKVILVNIFGGMTRCDEVAQGIVMACRSALVNIPIVIRFEGNNALKAREIISNARLDNLEMAGSLADVVQKSIYKIKA